MPISMTRTPTTFDKIANGETFYFHRDRNTTLHAESDAIKNGNLFQVSIREKKYPIVEKAATKVVIVKP